MKSRMFRVALAVVCILSLDAPRMAGAESLVRGHASVIDGQTLEIDGVVLQLRGVLSPPPDMICTTKRDKPYPCGRLALKALSDLLKGQNVACEFEGTVQAGRAQRADCRIGAFSVNEQLLLTGRVIAAAGAATSHLRAEKGAKVLREGLWKGAFPPPESWRPQ